MKNAPPDPGAVRAVQLGLLALFWVFIIGIIVWIIGLIRLSLRLEDIPSASIGISLVAIPVFLLLLGLGNYVFWGLRAAAREEGEAKRPPAGNGGVRHEA